MQVIRIHKQSSHGSEARAHTILGRYVSVAPFHRAGNLHPHSLLTCSTFRQAGPVFVFRDLCGPRGLDVSAPRIPQLTFDMLSISGPNKR